MDDLELSVQSGEWTGSASVCGIGAATSVSESGAFCSTTFQSFTR